MEFEPWILDLPDLEAIMEGDDPSLLLPHDEARFSFLRYQEVSGVVVCLTHHTGMTTKDALKGHIRRFHPDSRQFDINKIRRKLLPSMNEKDCGEGYDLKSVPVCLGGELVTESHISYQSAPKSFRYPPISRLPYIEGIPVVYGYDCECCRVCFLELHQLENHISNVHKHLIGSEAHKRSTAQILMQSISSGRYSRFFQVSVPLDQIATATARVSNPQRTDIISSLENREEMQRSNTGTDEGLERLCRALMLFQSGPSAYPNESDIIVDDDFTKGIDVSETVETASRKNETPLFIKQISYDLVLTEIGVQHIENAPFYLLEKTCAEFQHQSDSQLWPDKSYNSYLTRHIERYLRKSYYLYKTCPPAVRGNVIPFNCNREGRDFNPTLRKDTLKKYSLVLYRLVLMCIRLFSSPDKLGEQGSEVVGFLKKKLPASLRNSSLGYHHGWVATTEGRKTIQGFPSYNPSDEILNGSIEQFLSQQKREDVLKWTSLDILLHRLLKDVLLQTEDSTTSEKFFIRYFTAFYSIRSGSRERKPLESREIRFLQAHEMSSDIAVLIYASSSCGIVELAENRSEIYHSPFELPSSTASVGSKETSPIVTLSRDGTHGSTETLQLKTMKASDVYEAFNCKRNTAVSYLRNELDIMLAINKSDDSRERYADCLRPEHMNLLCGTVDGLEMSLHDLGRAICEWRLEAENLISKDLLFGMNLPDAFENHILQLNDNFSNCEKSFSFTCTDLNKPITSVWAKLLLEHLWNADGKSSIWFEKVESRPDQIGSSNSFPKKYIVNEAVSRRWLHRAQILQKILLALLHVTGGGPARGTEIATYLVRNTSESQRSIFVLQGYMNIIARYNKTQACTQKMKPIIRMLPLSVSRLFLLYLLVVKPFEVFLVHNIHGYSAASRHSDYLFVESGKPFDGEKVCGSITAEFARKNLSLGFAQFRHFQSAMVRRFLDDRNVEFLDLLSRGETEPTESIQSAKRRLLSSSSFMTGSHSHQLFQQAGHSNLTADRQYATGKHTLPGASSSDIDKFRKASLALHNLLEFAYPGSIRNSVMMMIPPVSRSKDICERASPFLGSGINSVSLEHGDKLGKPETTVLNDDSNEKKRKIQMVGGSDISDQVQKRQKGCQAGHSSYKPDVIPICPAEVFPNVEKIDTKPTYTYVMNDLQFILPSLRAMMNRLDAMFSSEVQLEATKLSLDGREDMIVVMPTGSGKSLVFMLPTFIEKGKRVTVVVVPLNALSADMERRCREFGLSAKTWSQIQDMKFSNSGNQSTPDEQDYHILIVPVESVSSKDFQLHMRQLCTKKRLARVIVDEAHITAMAACYRPRMVDLGYALNFFGEPVPRILLSATIPPHWEKHIAGVHGIKNFKTLRSPTVRTNISFQVQELNSMPFLSKEHRYALQVHGQITQLQEKLRKVNEMQYLSDIPFNVIVYVPYTNMVEKIAENLEKRLCGRDKEQSQLLSPRETLILQYHSKLSDTQRKSSYDKWVCSVQNSDYQAVIMVSTGAFGTGIDTSSVRMVFRLMGAYSLIDYIQESGRAGRDGFPAASILIYDPKRPFELLENVTALKSKANKPLLDNRFEMFNEISLCQEASNWMISSQNCRRRSLFTLVDNVAPPPCLLASKDHLTWCDVCSRLSETQEGYGVIEIPDVSGASVRNELGNFSRFVGACGETQYTPDETLLMEREEKNFSPRCSKINSTGILGTASKNFADALSTRRAIAEGLAKFRNTMVKLQSACVLCFTSSFELHSDSLTCLEKMGGRCFRCLQRGHSREDCILKGARNGSVIRLKQHEKSCYGCGLHALNGVVLHTRGRVIDCPFSRAIEICFAAWFVPERRKNLCSLFSIRHDSALASPEVTVRFYDLLYTWLTEQSSNSTRLRLMEVIDHLYIEFCQKDL